VPSKMVFDEKDTCGSPQVYFFENFPLLLHRVEFLSEQNFPKYARFSVVFHTEFEYDIHLL